MLDHFTTVSERAAARDQSGSSTNRIAGLDTWRAVAAIIVVLDHLRVFPADLFGLPRTGIGGLLRLTMNCLFNGPAAVIAFFVISGFCIHIAQTRANPRLRVRNFYLRRAIRIGVPALAAVGLYQALRMSDLAKLNDGVLWSIICESIYYLLYPGLLMLGRRFGWLTLVAAAFVLSTGISVAQLDALRAAGNAYTALGWATAIVGLPCWLLGCWLAEHRGDRMFRLAHGRRIWLVRGGIFLIAFALRIAKFHSTSVAFSNCFTLNAFALPVTGWLGMELATSSLSRASQARAGRLLESMGKWSYSLYLMHPASTYLLAVIGIYEMPLWEPYLLLRLAVAFVMSYCFYLVIEAPAHRLAAAGGLRMPRLTKASA